VDPRLQIVPSPRGAPVENDYLQLRDHLLRHARHICRRREDADDLVQVAWMKVLGFYQRTGRALPPEPVLGAILAKTISNTFVDDLRRRKVQTAAVLELVSSERPEPTAPPLEELPSHLTVTDEQIEAAVATLSPKLREVYDRYYKEEKTYHQVAMELDLKPGTVAKRLHDAREKLKKILSRGS
jgi:RNA polymerase sigma-70 factor (ECF subfamily)